MNRISILEIEFATPEYDLSIRLRDQILRQPLGLNFTEADLSLEYDSYHLGAYSLQGHLIGCLVLKPLSNQEIKMRQVAVSEAFQGQQIGRQLVQYSESFAKKKGFDLIVLNARDTAVPFYKRLNYNIIGDQFVEVGIPHFKMEKYI